MDPGQPSIEELARLTRASKLYRRAEGFAESHRLVLCALKLTCVFVWLWPLYLLQQSLKLHDAAWNGPAETPLRKNICGLMQEIRRKLWVPSVISAMLVVVLAIISPPYDDYPPPQPTPTPERAATPIVRPTAMPAPSPAPPTLISTPVPPTLIFMPVPPKLLVKIDDKPQEVSATEPLTVEVRAGDTVKIEILLYDANGKELLPNLATYDWNFNPPDEENKKRVRSLNNLLHYSAPANRKGQIQFITVEVAPKDYNQKIITFQIVIL